MEKEFIKINELVKEHVGSYTKVDEELFNLGVELGRLLEKNNVEFHRLAFFSEQEKNSVELEVRTKRARAIQDVVGNIIKMAHIEQLKNDGYINYDTGWHAKNNPLSSEIEEKYNITYKSVFKDDGCNDFTVTFELNGKLKEIFQKHEVGTKIEITLCNNSGEDSQSIHTEKMVEESFYGTSISLFSYLNHVSVEQVESFATDVEKFYTFFCLRLT